MPTDLEIRELCSRVLHAPSDEEFRVALIHLQTALREQVTSAENKSLHLLFKMRESVAANAAKS